MLGSAKILTRLHIEIVEQEFVGGSGTFGKDHGIAQRCNMRYVRGTRLGWRCRRRSLLFVRDTPQLAHKGLAKCGAAIKIWLLIELRLCGIFVQWRWSRCHRCRLWLKLLLRAGTLAAAAACRLETLEEIGQRIGALLQERRCWCWIFLQVRMTVLGRAASCCCCGRGRRRLCATGKDIVVQLTQADQHVLIVEQIVRVGVGVRVAATCVQLLQASYLLVHLLAIVIVVTCKYFIKGGIHNVRLVLQLLLAGDWTHQGAEQILAIVLVRQLLRGVCRSRAGAWAWQTGQLAGQTLCAAAVGQLATERVCGCWCCRCG